MTLKEKKPSASIHTDDGFYKLTRPRKAVSVSTIWALDAFTAENGGTEVIEGSHLWSDEQVSQACDSPTNLKPIEMDAGSLVIFAGTMLHRGGGNNSSTMRRAFSNQYCEPWGRQQESFMVSVPRERVSLMSNVVQELLGYSIYAPFMGQLAGRHPQKSLAEGYVNSLIVDDEEIGLGS